MVIKNKDMIKEVRKNMRDGNGEIQLTHYVNKENLKNAKLLAKIDIPKDASIGEHEHKNETEYYLIIKGNGIVIDNGMEKEVVEGDVVVTGGGATHSIRNIGNTTLEMIAVIILD